MTFGELEMTPWCQAGCAMSSVAMYLSTRGIPQTPHSLNQWLIGHGGYVSDDLLVWAVRLELIAV